MSIENGNFAKPMSSAAVVSIEEYVYEKVKRLDVIVNIPQEPIFFQEYNHRTIIGLFPQFTTWGDNSVWEIQIIKITDKIIQRTMIRTSIRELSDLVSRFEFKNKSQEDYLKDRVVRYLKDFFTDDRVSKEVFLAKYNQYLRSVSDITGVSIQTGDI